MAVPAWLSRCLATIETVVSAIEAGVDSLPEFERLFIRLAMIVFRCTIYVLGIISAANLLFRMVKAISGL